MIKMMRYDETDNFKRNDRFTTVYGIALGLDAERTRQLQAEERKKAEQLKVSWWQKIWRKKPELVQVSKTPLQRGIRLKMERANQVRVYRSDINGNPVE